jgi:hypothetical protein
VQAVLDPAFAFMIFVFINRLFEQVTACGMKNDNTFGAHKTFGGFTAIGYKVEQDFINFRCTE